MKIDASDIRRLETQFEKMPEEIFTEAKQVFEKAAVNIKRNMIRDTRKSGYFRKIGATIDYDRKARMTGIEYEIGPDPTKSIGSQADVKQLRKSLSSGEVGRLANIAYFGGANGGGGTLDIDAPARKELPQLEKYLTKVLGDKV